MPLLGHRMQLAPTLTKIMIQLHATGWLHKAYESRSVIFFLDNMTDRTNETGECQDTETSSALPVDIRQPKIVGCEYSRRGNNAELSENNASFRINRHEAYIHPAYLASLRSHIDLESSPTNCFKAEYDMFSLDCVLLQIGLWRRPTELWKPAYQSKEPKYWRKRLDRRYIPELSGRYGEMYQRVVRDLLSLGDCKAGDLLRLLRIPSCCSF
jgi:hypothetical protein